MTVPNFPLSGLATGLSFIPGMQPVGIALSLALNTYKAAQGDYIALAMIVVTLSIAALSSIKIPKNRIESSDEALLNLDEEIDVDIKWASGHKAPQGNKVLNIILGKGYPPKSDAALMNDMSWAFEMNEKYGSNFIFATSLEDASNQIEQLGFNNLEAINIIGHGGPGKIAFRYWNFAPHHMGPVDWTKDIINSSNLNQHRVALQKITSSLNTDSSSITFLGCRVARGFEGKQFLAEFARLTYGQSSIHKNGFVYAYTGDILVPQLNTYPIHGLPHVFMMQMPMNTWYSANVIH